MNWIRRHLALLALLVLLASAAVLFVTGRLQVNLNGKRESENPQQADSGDKTTGNDLNRLRGTTVVLDEDEFRISGIRSGSVDKGSVPVFFQASGEVQLAEDRIAHVTFPIGGVVHAVEKGIGDQVAKGSPLCSIESVELGDARASYVGARAETDVAERNYGRWKVLFEKGLRTQNELFAAEAELTRAKLKLDAANAKLRALGADAQEIQALGNEGANAVSNRYTLTSPIAGSVLQRNVTVGQSVSTSDQVFFIGDLSEVWVQAVAHEQDLPSIKTGMPAVVRIPNMPGTSVTGRVTYVGQQVDEKTRTVPLRVLARNSKALSKEQFVLRPGLFTNIDIETGRRNDVLVIPFSAVQSDGSDEFVFVQTQIPAEQAAKKGSQAAAKGSNGKPAVAFERRPVQLGVRYGQLVEVKKGLHIGERVVVENAYLLESELEKSKLQDQD